MSKKTECKKSVEAHNFYVGLLDKVLGSNISEVKKEDTTVLISTLNTIAKNASISDEIKNECISRTEPIIWTLVTFRREVIEHLLNIENKDKVPTAVDVSLKTDMTVSDAISWLGVMQDVDIQCRSMCLALLNEKFSSDRDKTLLYSAIKTNIGIGRDVLKHFTVARFEAFLDEIEKSVFGEIIQPGT